MLSILRICHPWDPSRKLNLLKSYNFHSMCNFERNTNVDIVRKYPLEDFDQSNQLNLRKMRPKEYITYIRYTFIFCWNIVSRPKCEQILWKTQIYKDFSWRRSRLKNNVSDLCFKVMITNRSKKYAGGLSIGLLILAKISNWNGCTNSGCVAAILVILNYFYNQVCILNITQHTLWKTYFLLSSWSKNIKDESLFADSNDM